MTVAHNMVLLSNLAPSFILVHGILATCDNPCNVALNDCLSPLRPQEEVLAAFYEESTVLCYILYELNNFYWIYSKAVPCMVQKWPVSGGSVGGILIIVTSLSIQSPRKKDRQIVPFRCILFVVFHDVEVLHSCRRKCSIALVSLVFLSFQVNCYVSKYGTVESQRNADYASFWPYCNAFIKKYLVDWVITSFSTNTCKIRSMAVIRGTHGLFTNTIAIVVS